MIPAILLNNKYSFFYLDSVKYRRPFLSFHAILSVFFATYILIQSEVNLGIFWLCFIPNGSLFEPLGFSSNSSNPEITVLTKVNEFVICLITLFPPKRLAWSENGKAWFETWPIVLTIIWISDLH